MSSVQELLGSSTNFHRLKTVTEIHFTTFSHCNSNDQVLLDAELDLRRREPKVLATMYGKELWVFSIDEKPIPTCDASFGLKQSSVQSFSPDSIYRSTNGVPSSLMPVLIVTFLKSLKRLLINNLSFRKQIIPFGNSGILSDSSLLQIEPKVLERGDIVISMTTIDHGLCHLSEISTSESDLSAKFAIFLAPSGIRVYLAESTIEKSQTGKPSNHSFIIDTLLDLHNIRIDADICTWIKVVPNLPHLNAMTSQISDYLKPVTNVKYLAWPLELCVCKEASLASDNHFDWFTPEIDPLSLVDDFVCLKASSNAKTPSTVPTANNTPVTVEPHIDHGLDARPLPHDVLSTNSIPSQTIEVTLDSINQDWGDLDEELFGEGGEITENDFNFFNQKEALTDSNTLDTDTIMNDAVILPGSNIDEDVQLTDDLFEDDMQDDNLASELELLTERDQLFPGTQTSTEVITSKRPYHHDIPLLQLSNSPSPLYEDPGAPLPIQSPRLANRKRSIFSPLNFNPIIKSNVDNKYSSGGKFFVANVETPSDSCVPVISLSESIGQDEGDFDDFDDSDEEVDDEEEPEENEDKTNGFGNYTFEESNDSNMIVEESPFSKVSVSSGKGTKLSNEKSQSPGEQLPTTAKSVSPSPETTNGVPNSLPFLLRSIPIHSIPSQFYKTNPTVLMNELGSFLKDFLDQIIWNDSFHQDLPDFDDLQDISLHNNIIRAIAPIFPDIQKENLSNYLGISEISSDNIGSPSASFKELDFVDASTTDDSALKHSKVQGSIFPISEPKFRVKRLSQEISINSNALNFWNTLGFKSLNPPKDFRVVLFSPTSLAEQSKFFLSTLTEIYEKHGLGSIGHFSVPGSNIQDGLLFIDTKDFYDTYMKSASRINEVLVREEVPPKDILIIIPVSTCDLKSTVEIIKLFQNFKNSIIRNGLSTLQIKVSLKIIPSSYITNRGVLSIVSTNLLTKLSLSIYNLLGDVNQTYTTLNVPMPEKINFQLTTQPIASEILSQDSFIHLAYERSIDKEWLVASWSDQYAKIRDFKAWNCSNKMKNSLENVMNEIWSKSLEISNKLTGRKYLILVRSDGAIPDDELLQWKRLSSKSRELTLVVISVDQNPVLKLQLNNPGFPLKKIFNQEQQMFQDSNTRFKIDSVPPTTGSTGLTPLTIFTPQPMNSPDLFSNSRSGGVESPSDSRFPNDEQGVIVDANDIVHAILMDGPNSLSNSPVRLGVKTGYLIKGKPHSNNILNLFELNLMSCPGTLAMENLMKTVLIQFRNLATVAELFGVSNHEDTLIPWHILAVRKSISCLTHIRLEEEEVSNTTK